MDNRGRIRNHHLLLGQPFLWKLESHVVNRPAEGTLDRTSEKGRCSCEDQTAKIETLEGLRKTAQKIHEGGRIKGAIDDRIKEEQARQAKAQQGTRAPPRRRPQAHDGSAARTQSRQRDSTNDPAAKSPDPSDFTIGDDDSASISRVATPVPQQEGTNGNQERAPPAEGDGQEQSSNVPTGGVQPEGDPERLPVMMQDLPPEVKIKLRRLDKLESKYAELLKAYRAAHARVQTIEPFEATLRETTPLTSISDPSAFSEYLTQINTKSGMVLDELKRVSGERDDFKKQADASEVKVKELEGNVHHLKTQLDEQPSAESVKSPKPATVDTATPAVGASLSKDDASSVTSPQSASSRIPSLSIFSPKSKPKIVDAKDKDASEDLFSFDSEVPKLQAQLEERQKQVDDLTTQVANLQKDLRIARESTEGMMQNLETTSGELSSLRDSKDKLEVVEKELRSRIEAFESEQEAASNNKETEEKVASLQKELEETRALLQEANDRVQQLESQEAETSRQLAQAKADVDHLNKTLEDEKKTSEALGEKVQQKDHINKDLEDSLAFAKKAEREHESTTKNLQASERRIQTMQGIMDSLRAQLDKAELAASALKEEISKNQQENDKSKEAPSLSSTSASLATEEAGTGGKKKNKKKKKSKSAAPTSNTETQASETGEPAEDTTGAAAATRHAPQEVESKTSELSEHITKLEAELEDKKATVDRLSRKIKDQESLQEEIETLRDDLLHQGQEHVEARDALKEAQKSRQVLHDRIVRLEKELDDARTQINISGEAAETHQQTIQELEEKKVAYAQATQELDELNSRATQLQTDLAAAEQLAASRFKDITDLKDLLGKAQPELRTLRKEAEELKTVRDELKNKSGEMSRLESKHEEVKAELKNLGKRLSTQDTENRSLRSKVETETKLRERAEGEIQAKESELRSAEARKNGAIEMHESVSKDLSKTKEETQALHAKLRDVNEQLTSYERQISSLKEEVALKTALHGSSQSLVQSLRDQMHELNVQTREVTSRSESMEEELAEAQRMLSERTRESQTMRMLLNQAESGTEARIREMKERMDAAIEERDRLEDEYSVSSRRMAREVEDVKNKSKDAQRQLKTLEAEKEDLETRSREWRKLREDLEYASKSAEREAEETRNAMKGLREAVDESERQIRVIETQKAELRRQADEATERVDKLSKANKNLSEEMKSLQTRAGVRSTVRPGGVDSGLQSSRTSIDSASARSPAPPASRAGLSSTTSLPRSETPTAGGGGLSQGTVDYVYLKNVLLQFLSQKDKGHQRQLIPVIGMLLHFDDKDQQRWNAAVSAR